MKKRILSALMALLLAASLPMTAFAVDWYLEDGSITVSADNSGQTVSQGGSAAVEDAAPVIKQRDSTTTTTNTVTIKADAEQTANVTLSGVNIDVSKTGDGDTKGSAAVSAEGVGSVTIELEGENTVKSGYDRAGLEKNNTGSLTITDANNDGGSLTAQGGYRGAGIGGGNNGSVSGITISGGKVDAQGNAYGAGIGGGWNGSGSDITISDAEVTARSLEYGAGIGGGWKGSGSNITITDSEVNATGGYEGAGIGGGVGGNGSDITLSGSRLTAKGSDGGAGIGGGDTGSGSNITITGGTTEAVGGIYAAGIGGGWKGSGSNITVSGDAQLKVQGGKQQYNDFGTGAPIGNGGTASGEDPETREPINGAEVTPDVSELTAEGQIEYYAPGVDMSTAQPIEDKTINGEHEHEWDGGVVTKEPTCTEKGVMTYTCQAGNNFKKTKEIQPVEHKFTVYVPDGNASCDEDGSKTAKCVWYDQCGKEDTLPNEGGRLNHSFEGQEYFPDGNASCEQDGSKTAKCVRYGIGGCTATDTLPDEGSRLPHTVVTDEAVAPTYTHTGLTEGSHCSVCSEVLKAQKVVPALPIYRVKDADGRSIRYKAERKDGVLTITVDADFAILTGELRGVQTLKAQGVERIEFITNSAISPFAPDDLLAKGGRGETYHLTHDGETVTFILGAKKTDVSDILEGA